MTAPTSLHFTLGDALRKSRTQPQLEGVGRRSQEFMAEKLDVSRPTVGAWEAGKQDPPFPAVVEWARLTGWPLEWFEEAAAENVRSDNSFQPSLFDLAA